MEKGHYGQYTGNARHSRKEEMIHDRELIYDAKKQLHKADQDYKHDSPAKMYKDSPVNGNAFTKAMADSGGDYDKAKQMLDSPAQMSAKEPLLNLSGKKGLQPSNNPAAAYMTGGPILNVACKYTKK